MKVSVTNVVVGALLLCAGYSFREPGETVVITRVDTIPYAQWKDSAKAATLSADGWKAKALGRVVVQPRTILRTDTLVSPPDTVLQLVAVHDGYLTVAPLIRSTDPMLRIPEVHRFDVGNCDDGFSWNAGELVCDKARLGHLSAFLSAGAVYPFGTTASGGIEWQPSYRSGWRASIALDPNGRATASVVRLLRVF